MKILVTACNGQLGIDLTEYFKNRCEIVAFKDVDLDITDKEKVFKVVKEVSPDIIINTAAITNVDGCETNEELAYKVNAKGAEVMALAAQSCGASIVHISTDYVFDGTSSNPYTENDEPCPKSAYGRSKLEGERFVTKYEKSYILRTAWLYGPHGNNFVKTMLRIGAEKGEVAVVTDQVGNPTSTFELVRMIEAVLNSGKYGIYHTTCSGVCSWNDFAHEIFRMAGMNVNVTDVTSEQFVRPASRPAYSNLSKDKLIRECGYTPINWHDALAEYFEYCNKH